MLPFEPEEEQKINDVLEWMQKQLESHGLKLPDPGTITFMYPDDGYREFKNLEILEGIVKYLTK